MPPKITRVKWSASNLPWGISFDESTGTFSGTPEDDIGEFIVPVSVQTNYGIAEPKDVKIKIKTGSVKITNTSLTAVEIHYAYSHQMTTNSTQTVTWSAIGLPDGLYIDSNTGLISGQVDKETSDDTTYSVFVSLYNENGLKRDEREYTLTVRGMYPHLTTGATGDTGVTYELDFPCVIAHHSPTKPNVPYVNQYWIYTPSDPDFTKSLIFQVIHGCPSDIGVNSVSYKYTGWTNSRVNCSNGTDTEGQYGNIYRSSNGNLLFTMRFLEDSNHRIKIKVNNSNPGTILYYKSSNGSTLPSSFALAPEGFFTIETEWGSLKINMPLIHYRY